MNYKNKDKKSGIYKTKNWSSKDSVIKELQ
jgi:hypothetical protein